MGVEGKHNISRTTGYVSRFPHSSFPQRWYWFPTTAYSTEQATTTRRYFFLDLDEKFVKLRRIPRETQPKITSHVDFTALTVKLRSFVRVSRCRTSDWFGAWCATFCKQFPEAFGAVRFIIPRSETLTS